MPGHLVAAATGGLLGWIALRLPEVARLAILALLGAMVTYYWQQERTTDAGWLLLGTGGIPALILGANGYKAVTDPSIDVGVDTWIMLGAALLLVLGGLALVLRASRPARRVQGP